MLFPTSALSFFLALLPLELVVAASSHSIGAMPRKRQPSTPPPVADQVHEWNVTRRADSKLAKRFSDARFTFYEAGLGACGKTNSGSDFIVALNAAQYASGSHCFETITISYGGKSTSAQIMDLCPGCPYGGLDLTEGLFQYFASEDLGVIQGSWSFGSGGGDSGDSTTTTAKAKATTTTQKQTPQTTSTPTPTTTTKAQKTSTSTTSSSSSSSRSSASATIATGTTAENSSSTSNVAVPTAGVSQDVNLVLLQLGEMLVAAAQVSQ